MTTWRQDYLLALEARDRSEQAQKALYNAYTRLADRTAGIETRAIPSNENVIKPDPTSANVIPAQMPAQTSSDADVLLKTRTDLSEAQRSRGILQARLQDATNDLQQLRLQSASDRKRLGELNLEKTTLAIRIKDRDEELKGKAKFLEVWKTARSHCTITDRQQDTQNENVSLTLQLNMAEDRAQKLKKENEDLVERWMKRMGIEADAMNEASKFH
ncbi:MAG: hypothetical protein Q9211_000852 [Gyalolechia sp. 1 TL-2023]